jgi:hypothetical protein
VDAALVGVSAARLQEEQQAIAATSAAEALHIDQILLKVPDVLPNSLVLLCLEEALLTKACLDFISSILNDFVKGLEIAQSYLELLVTNKIGV